MPFKTPNIRLVAGGPLAFLFLVVAAMTMLQHAVKVTASDELACLDEYSLCNADAVCAGCYSVDQTSDAFTACLSDAAETLKDSCEAEGSSACCIDEVSEYDCFGSSAFVTMALCLVNAWAEQTGQETCGYLPCTSGIGGSGASGTSGDGNYSPRVIPTLVGWLTVLLVAPLLAVSTL